MNTPIELIQILDAIERNGSFEAAAQELHKVRSALTYTIRKFEERFKIEIYDRSGHRAILTETGRALLEQGRHLIELSNQIIDNVKQISTGWEPIVKVAYDEILSIDPLFNLVKQFQKQAPGTSLELQSEVLGGCMDALIHHRVSIAIGFPGPLPSKEELIFEAIGKTQFVFAVAPHHPLAKIKGILSTDLIKKYHAIVTKDSAKQTPLRSAMLLSGQSRITFSSIALKKQAQILGLGVGFLPYNLIKENIKDGSLIVKEVERQQQPVYLYIGWNKTVAGKAHQWIIDKIKNKKFWKDLLR